MQSYSKIVAFKLTTENGLPGAVGGRGKATKGSTDVMKEVNTVVLGVRVSVCQFCQFCLDFPLSVFHDVEKSLRDLQG